MSVQAISWVLDHSQATLGARLVLISIANHADKYGRDARASVASYAEEAHLSERQTRYAIRKLEELGEIRRVGQYAYRADRVVFVYEIWPMTQDSARVRDRQNPPPAETAGGQSSAVPGGKIVPIGGQPIAPKPSLNRPGTNRPHMRFGEFWSIYPRHRSRKTAEQAFAKAAKGHDPDVILEGLRRALPDFSRRPTDKVPYAASWLNAEGFLDEAEADPVLAELERRERERA